MRCNDVTTQEVDLTAHLTGSGNAACSAEIGPGRSHESRQDWLLVLSAFIGLAVSVMYVYSIGLFFAPLEAEFGWSRGQIAAGMTIVSVVTVAVAPFVGMAVDRYGSRVIACVGMSWHCIAIALLATTTGSIWHWWSMWILVSAGTVLIKPTVWMAAIASRFKARRGLAIGFAMCGIGVGSAVMPSLATMLIDGWGWRAAYVLLGAGGALVALPMMFFFFRDGSRVTSPLGVKVEQLPGLSRREGLRSRRFHKMALAGFLATFSTIALTVHFVPILMAEGVARESAAFYAGAIGTASIIGRAGTGYLLDRIDGTIVGAIGCALPIVTGIMLLNFDGSLLFGIICAAVLGFAMGTEVDVFAYLSARYFGLRNYGMLFGTLAGMLALGSGVGAAFGGAMYDYYGSYHMLILILLPVYAVTSLLIGTLGRTPDEFS